MQNLPKIRQLNDYYCGPAVLAMLLGFQNTKVKQKEIVNAAQVGGKIKIHGMNLEDLSRACHFLAPNLDFWYKRNSTITELSRIVNIYKTPVGIEWQGIFKDEGDESEENDEDAGHYSIVTSINTNENYIHLRDPYKEHINSDRNYTILEFERRWWDINDVIHPISHRLIEIDDYHAMFIVLPKTESFPQEFNMEKYY